MWSGNTREVWIFWKTLEINQRSVNKTSVWNRYVRRMSVNEQRSANEEQIEKFKRFLELNLDLGIKTVDNLRLNPSTLYFNSSPKFQPSLSTFSLNLLFKNYTSSFVFQSLLPTFFSNFFLSSKSSLSLSSTSTRRNRRHQRHRQTYKCVSSVDVLFLVVVVVVIITHCHFPIFTWIL